jgi:enamine deaminase RidA (YjgF/YER057c/UK114 family)
MLTRNFLSPDNVWQRIQKTDECPEGELLYVPVTLNIDKSRTFIYLAGQTARLPNGDVASDNMRDQLRQTCENIGICLNYVGATFDDVVTSKTYVLDLQEYYGVSDERFKYFKNNRPASTLLQISGLGFPKCKIEITVEAIIETDRLTIDY